MPRHQTLLAAMDWSHSLLPAGEQVVLRRLAVFPGSFSLAAVEAVVGSVVPDAGSGAGFEVLDLLSRLVDKSMVGVSSEEPEVRYTLLETVREYAGQKLAEAGELEPARTRHRDFFLGQADRWAERSRFHDWGSWIHEVIADQDNFAAALAWSSAQDDHEELLRLAAAHWPYWYWAESLGWRQWLAEALNRCPTPSPARAEALIGLATLLRGSAEDGPDIEALFQEAMAVAEGLGSDQLIAQVDFYWADLVLARGDRRAAEVMVRDSLVRWERAGFVYGVGWGYFLLGWIALSEGDVEGAAARFETSSARAEEADDDSMRAHVSPALALVAALRGDHERARTLAAEGIRTSEGIEGVPRLLMMALARASQVAVLSGDASTTALVCRLLGLQRDLGVRYWVDEVLDVAALVLADRLPDDAAVVLAAGHSLREALEDSGSQVGALGDRLRSCRIRLMDTLGADGWEAAQDRATTMTPEEAVVHALAAVESLTTTWVA